MARLSVEEILDAIISLPKEERKRFEEEYERRAWEECLRDPDVIAMIKNRHMEVQQALKQGDVKSLEQLRAEFEANGLL
jgi:hypothetical protein